MILVFGRNSFTGYNPDGCSHVWACDTMVWDGRNFYMDSDENGGAFSNKAVLGGGVYRTAHIGLCWGGSGSFSEQIDIEDLGHGVGKITIINAA